MALFSTPLSSLFGFPYLYRGKRPAFGRGQFNYNKDKNKLGIPAVDVASSEIPSLAEGGLLENTPWAQVTPEAADAMRGGGISGMESVDTTQNPWGGMTPEAMAATRPQQGGLFGGLKGAISNNWMPLLQAGLGMMEAGGWQKMPVTLGQAMGRGGIPAIGTKIHLDEQARQDEYRQEQLAQMRLTRQAYADQIESQNAQRKAALQAENKIKGLFDEYNKIDPNDPLAAEKRWGIYHKIAAHDKAIRDELIKGEIASRKPGDLQMKWVGKSGNDGKPIIDPRTGDQVQEAWWFDKQGNKVKKVEGGDKVGSGINVNVQGPQMFDKTTSAFDVEEKLRKELEPKIKESKSGVQLAQQFKSAIDLGTPSGYKAAATIAQKLIEPENQALINEISRLEGGGDLVERIRGGISQFITGTPAKQQIEDLKKFAAAMERVYRGRSLRERKAYRDLGEQYKRDNQYISPDRIVLPDEELDAWEALSE